jgi:hypothetical protein
MFFVGIMVTIWEEEKWGTLEDLWSMEETTGEEDWERLIQTRPFLHGI